MQVYMGHEKIETTMRYVHFVPKVDAAAKGPAFIATQMENVSPLCPEPVTSTPTERNSEQLSAAEARQAGATPHSLDEFPVPSRSEQVMAQPLVHLELHTGDLAGARAFYAGMCGWRPEQITVPSGSYLALELGGGLGGGIVECDARRPLWLPYVEVPDVGEATERARRLGAKVVLDPREGPVGWRATVAAPAAGELALWQPKR